MNMARKRTTDTLIRLHRTSNDAKRFQKHEQRPPCKRSTTNVTHITKGSWISVNSTIAVRIVVMMELLDSIQ